MLGAARLRAEYIEVQGTSYNWAYNPIIIPLNGLIGVTPIISSVIVPVTCTLRV